MTGMILLLAHERPDGDVDTYHLKPGRRYHIGRGSGCEVRILDLKLSRKHAVVEFADNVWRFVDLGSTNGCTVNDILADDPLPLKPGSVIVLGQTTLRVLELAEPAPIAVIPEAKPVYQRQPSNEFQPGDIEETQTAVPTADPLTAIRSATPVPSAPEAVPVAIPLAVEIPRPPSGRQPSAYDAASATLTDERPFFITVLGTRVGPLNKAQARELKARELKGLLKPEDLASYPKA